mmetsp:Transcript_36910/g.47704  ORF Transcript_36910/g.47704 Transcript_36910/m.47704 type:complete len:278 (+) Transcript_36910:632-1465(+)
MGNYKELSKENKASIDKEIDLKKISKEAPFNDYAVPEGGWPEEPSYGVDSIFTPDNPRTSARTRKRSADITQATQKDIPSSKKKINFNYNKKTRKEMDSIVSEIEEVKNENQITIDSLVKTHVSEIEELKKQGEIMRKEHIVNVASVMKHFEEEQETNNIKHTTEINLIKEQSKQHIKQLIENISINHLRSGYNENDDVNVQYQTILQYSCSTIETLEQESRDPEILIDRLMVVVKELETELDSKAKRLFIWDSLCKKLKRLSRTYKSELKDVFNLM